MCLLGMTLCFITRKMSKEDDLSLENGFHQYYFNHGQASSNFLSSADHNFMPTISSALPLGVFAQEPSMPLLLPFKTLSSAIDAETQKRTMSLQYDGSHKSSSQDSPRRCSLPVIDSLVHAALAYEGQQYKRLSNKRRKISDNKIHPDTEASR